MENAILVDENGQWEVPLSMIHVGDTVIIVTTKQGLNDINDILE